MCCTKQIVKSQTWPHLNSMFSLLPAKRLLVQNVHVSDAIKKKAASPLLKLKRNVMNHLLTIHTPKILYPETNSVVHFMDTLANAHCA